MVFVAVRRFFLVVSRGSYSPVAVHRLPTVVASLVVAHRL